MKRIPCRGGRFVEVIDDDHWIAPIWRGAVPKTANLDFTRLPASVRPWWRAVLGEAFQLDSLAQVRGIWHTALWLYRFHIASSRPPTTRWDDWSANEWATYAEWLSGQQGFRGRPLSLDYRRGQFLWLAAAAQHAVDLRLSGTSAESIRRIKSVARGSFRGTAVAFGQRLVRRALTREQWEELDRILAEEWQRYQDNGTADGGATALPAVVATWLAFHHGVRSAEINRLSVHDILPDPVEGRHHLRVHAPNKAPDLLPIGRETLRLLEALKAAGAGTRTALQTDLLFVSTAEPPAILTTSSVPWEANGLTDLLRALIARHNARHLPSDLKFPDGRTTLGTHLAYDLGNRERVRQIMRHQSPATTDHYYRVHDKLRVARDVAAATRTEAIRLTMACQRPIASLDERPDHREVIGRNPANTQLEYGSCGLDAVRQGSCRMAVHCFECPLLVPWVSKRHNFVHERDVYQAKAAEAINPRDQENYIRHAALAEAHIRLIDRRKEGGTLGPDTRARSRRPRRSR